jgi:carbonic anhydrase
MIDRRRFIVAAAAPAAASFASRTFAQGTECAVFTPARQSATSPDQALKRLQEGNARFVSGQTINCDLRLQVKETAGGQAPFAALVGCIDSRVPPELVFDQRLGDVFCARVAGNFVNDDIIGSLEFATKLAGARLIVVLGHSDCGAIKGAVDGAKLGFLTAMLRHIAPAVQASRNVAGEHNAKNKAYVQAVADANAKLAAAALTRRSAVLKELVDKKALRVVSAMHDLSTGRVTFFV